MEKTFNPGRSLVGVLFAVCVLFALPAYGQVTVIEQNKTVKEALKSIEQASGYRFFYSEGLKDLDRKVSISVVDVSIETAMKTLLEGTQITYRITGDKIIVLSSKAQEQQNGTEASKDFITGIVKNEAGNPLTGVSVVVSGTQKGTTTDRDGKFRIEAPQGTPLDFYYLGMENQQVKASGRNVEVILTEKLNQLDRVVVVGYGTSKKSDLTGAVSSINTDDLPTGSNASIATMLSGMAAGVTVQQTSAQPGGGVEIMVRGAAGTTHDPLYVIDGFPVNSTSVEPGSNNRYSNFGSHNALNSINPNDIESIEVLKDASSSAIYGARAANGVVLITTKKGREGRAVVSYDGSYGVQSIANRIEVLSATEFMNKANDFSYEKWLFDNRYYPYGATQPGTPPSTTTIYSEAQIANAGKGTDWYDLITRGGSVQQHNVSLTGGKDGLTYMTSFNYYDQEGVVRNSDFERITGRFNVEQKIGKIFTFGMNSTMSYIKNTNIPLGTEDFENSGLINSALTYDPSIPVYNSKGEYEISPLMAMVPNPVSMLEITDYTKTRRFLVNAFAQAEIIPGLIAKVNLGIDDNTGNRYSYLPKTTMYGKQAGGSADRSNAQALSRMIEGTLTYNFKVGEHHKFSVLAGWSAEDLTYENLAATSSQFFTDAFLYNNLGAGAVDRPTVSSGKTVTKYQSFFGRINYNLKEKYLLTVNFRADGSDRFGENNRYGYFPSAALAWRIKQEDFLKDVNWLSDLKLRVGGGQTGNAMIGLSAYEYYSADWRQYVFGKNMSTGTYKSQLGNPDLKWETTTEYNIGLDFGFLNHRITGSFDYFDKEIKDLLGWRNLQSFMEVTGVQANVGKRKSRGTELSLHSVNFQGKFRWTTDFNYTRYVDRWKERDPQSFLSPWQKNDDPINAYYGYVADGILRVGEEAPSYMPDLLPGQFKVKDVNGYLRDDFGNPIVDANGKYQYTGAPDGTLDQADIVMIGTTDPGFSLGFGNSFQYKGFDLNIFFYGMFDRLVYNATRDAYSVYELRRVLQGKNFIHEVLDSWSSKNTDSDLPSGFVTSYPQPGTFLWEKGWFIRCRNITLGYTVPHKWVGKYLSKARIYAEVGNPFVITPYTGNDPETDFKAGYPNQRTFMMGINLVF